MAPNGLSPINLVPGEVVGLDDQFKPTDGDTSRGGRGQKIGKISCDPVEYLNDYHVHIYLGIVANGKQIAVPDAIGLDKPGPEQNGYITTAGCYYFIHTHDASGMIHIEDPNNLPPSATPYTFSSFLKIWGMRYTKTTFGKYHGKMLVFVGNPAALGQTEVTSYQQWKGGLGAIPLRSHEVIWIEIGKPFTAAKYLPPVTFYTEY